MEDNAGNLWLSGSTDGTEMLLSKYDGKSFIKITSSKQIFDAIQDSSGNIWFGTEKGISRYDGKAFNDFLD
jgi:ligand-binding sensor domain-containing protein